MSTLEFPQRTFPNNRLWRFRQCSRSVLSPPCVAPSLPGIQAPGARDAWPDLPWLRLQCQKVNLAGPMREPGRGRVATDPCPQRPGPALLRSAWHRQGLVSCSLLHVRCPGLFVGLNVSWEGLLACPARGAAKKLQVVRGVSDRTS